MFTVSLCMIVKNEQQVLQRCIESIKDFTDEIIIVDTGSTDLTKEIAQKYGSVYDFKWCDDFSKARNFAFSKAKSDYIMWLDADDVIKKESLDKLLNWKKTQNSNEIDVVMMPYHLDIDENGNSNFIYYRERILKNKAGFIWQGAVHECIQPTGKIVYLDIPVEHHKEKESKLSDRNLKIYQKQLKKDGTLDARSKFYYARELMTHKMFEKAVNMFEGFINDENGWIENKIEALRNLSYCFMMQNQIENAKKSLLNAFLLDEPRAEICCDLAMIFVKQEQYDKAKFWYKTAYKCFPDAKKGGFTQIDCYGYIPCIGLCVCYDYLGQKDKAIKWNEKAGIFKPDSKAVLHNRAYFNNV